MVVKANEDAATDVVFLLTQFPTDALNDSSIRALIFLEILYRARKDFIVYIRKIFEHTWEFKILKVLLEQGPMNKSKLCFSLFESKERHYKLSRASPVYYAFNRLLENKIIIIVEDLGRAKVYDISGEYKALLERLLIG